MARTLPAPDQAGHDTALEHFGPTRYNNDAAYVGQGFEFFLITPGRTRLKLANI